MAINKTQFSVACHVDPLLLALSVVCIAEIPYSVRMSYLIIVSECQRKLVGVGRLKLLEDDLRRKGLEQSLINIQ